jgi:hypothetical protein
MELVAESPTNEPGERERQCPNPTLEPYLRQILVQMGCYRPDPGLEFLGPVWTSHRTVWPVEDLTIVAVDSESHKQTLIGLVEEAEEATIEKPQDSLSAT